MPSHFKEVKDIASSTTTASTIKCNKDLLSATNQKIKKLQSMQARQNSAPARKLGKIKSNIREMRNTNPDEEEVCEGGDECTNGADECKEEEEFKLINNN